MDNVIYTGEGDYMIGLPARNLTNKEWEAIPEELRESALEQGLYKLELDQSEVEDA